jgi:hypothetical protein
MREVMGTKKIEIEQGARRIAAVWRPASPDARRRKMTMRRALMLSLGIAACLGGFASLAQDLPTLTVGGVTYTNVKFGTITPTSVSIMHSAGIATLPLSALPASLQEEFNYDPERVKRAAEAAARQQEIAKNAYHLSGTTIQVLDNGVIFRGNLMTYIDKAARINNLYI